MEIERCRHRQECLGNGHSLEFNSQRLSYGATRSIRPNQESSAQFFALSILFNRQVDVFRILANFQRLTSKADLGMWIFNQRVSQELRHAPLLTLHPIRMWRFISEDTQVKSSDRTFSAIAELPQRTDETLRDAIFRGAKTFEHFERGRMERGRSQISR